MFNEISKMAVRQLVALNVAKASTNLIVNNSDVDPDSITLKVGTMVVGEVASAKAGPYTDNAVDKAFTWIASKRTKKTLPAE
jgi:hypothetical protein